MKGAVLYENQLLDRSRKFNTLGLPILIELHTFGKSDLDSNDGFKKCVENCDKIKREYEVNFVVHVTPQDPEIVTRKKFDLEQVLRTIEFAQIIDSKEVVLHRYYGFKKDSNGLMPKSEAEQEFNEIILNISRMYGGVAMHIENFGFVWLPPVEKEIYLVSPLDHFFPWEIKRFQEFLKEQNITNVTPMVDIAHATLSSNMFNLLRTNYNRFRVDPRFANITEEDLDQKRILEPYEYIRSGIQYYHISDAIFANEGFDFESVDVEGHINKNLLVWLTTESKPLGKGNLDFKRLMEIIGGNRAENLILTAEIDPGEGSTYDDNKSQEEAIKILRNLESNFSPD